MHNRGNDVNLAIRFEKLYFSPSKHKLLLEKKGLMNCDITTKEKKIKAKSINDAELSCRPKGYAYVKILIETYFIGGAMDSLQHFKERH